MEQEKDLADLSKEIFDISRNYCWDMPHKTPLNQSQVIRKLVGQNAIRDIRKLSIPTEDQTSTRHLLFFTTDSIELDELITGDNIEVRTSPEGLKVAKEIDLEAVPVGIGVIYYLNEPEKGCIELTLTLYSDPNKMSDVYSKMRSTMLPGILSYADRLEHIRLKYKFENDGSK